MIVWTEAMNLLVIANPRVEHVSAICSLVITATVFLEFTSAMETTIVWIIPMKMNVINAVSFTIMHSLPPSLSLFLLIDSFNKIRLNFIYNNPIFGIVISLNYFLLCFLLCFD